MRREWEDCSPDAFILLVPFLATSRCPKAASHSGLSAVVGLGIPLCSACFHGRNSQVSTLLLISLGQGTGAGQSCRRQSCGALWNVIAISFFP